MELLKDCATNLILRMYNVRFCMKIEKIRVFLE